MVIGAPVHAVFVGALGRRSVFARAAVVALGEVTTACGAAASQTAVDGNAQRVTVTAREMAFSPARVEVRAGQPVALTLTNVGSIEHDWQVTLAGAGGTPGETIRVLAAPGRAASKTFTVPAPGTFEVICGIPGHAQLGMTGTLTAR